MTIVARPDESWRAEDKARSCDGKTPYPTRIAAQKTAAFFTRRNQVTFEAYRCRHGEHYHVGHAIPPGKWPS